MSASEKFACAFLWGACCYDFDWFEKEESVSEVLPKIENKEEAWKQRNVKGFCGPSATYGFDLHNFEWKLVRMKSERKQGFILMFLNVWQYFENSKSKQLTMKLRDLFFQLSSYINISCCRECIFLNNRSERLYWYNNVWHRERKVNVPHTRKASFSAVIALSFKISCGFIKIRFILMILKSSY